MLRLRPLNRTMQLPVICCQNARLIVNLTFVQSPSNHRPFFPNLPLVSIENGSEQRLRFRVRRSEGTFQYIQIYGLIFYQRRCVSQPKVDQYLNPNWSARII
jgi:hypothetical protein